jgi:hypothetical protein
MEEAQGLLTCAAWAVEPQAPVEKFDAGGQRESLLKLVLALVPEQVPM